MSLISIQSVHFHYRLGKVDLHALRGVSFSIRKGEIVCLMGPSGSGKSTLINVMGCLEKPSAGEVFIHGQAVSKMSDAQLSEFRNQHIGFIFQNFNLISVLSALENVEYPLLLRKNARVDHKKSRALLEAVGLSDYVNHRPDQLSGGQRQRVAIARALVGNPDIILADEPTANLDSQTGEEILQLLMRVQQEYQTAILFSTHDPTIAQQYAHRIIQIRDGVLEEKQGEGSHD